MHMKIIYIYNIKLMEENTLLIKKITFKHVFCFIYFNFFINSIKYVFFCRTKTVFQNSISEHNFFPENTKNCS